MNHRDHEIIWNNCHRPILSKNIWERGLDKGETLLSELNTGNHELSIRKFSTDDNWGWHLSIRLRPENPSHIGESIEEMEWTFKERDGMPVNEAERKALKHYRSKYA